MYIQIALEESMINDKAMHTKSQVNKALMAIQI